jgi:hypothetical protein
VCDRVGVPLAHGWDTMAWRALSAPRDGVVTPSVARTPGSAAPSCSSWVLRRRLPTGATAAVPTA